jgi:hypothetical protein
MYAHHNGFANRHGNKNRTSISSIGIHDIVDGPTHDTMMSDGNHFSHGNYSGGATLGFGHGGGANLTIAAPTPMPSASNASDWAAFWAEHGHPDWVYGGAGRNGHGHGRNESADDSVIVVDRAATANGNFPLKTSMEGKLDGAASDGVGGSLAGARGAGPSGVIEDDGRTITAPASPLLEA